MAYDSVLCRAWARKGIIDGVNGPKYAQPLSELMPFAHGFCTFSKEVNSTSPLLKFELMLQLAFGQLNTEEIMVCQFQVWASGGLACSHLLYSCSSSVAKYPCLGEPAEPDTGPELSCSIVPAKAKLNI